MRSSPLSRFAWVSLLAGAACGGATDSDAGGEGLGGQGSGGEPPGAGGAAGSTTQTEGSCSYVAVGPVMLDRIAQIDSSSTGYAVSWAVNEVLYGDLPTYSLEFATLDLTGQVQERATVFSGFVTEPRPNVEDGYLVYPSVRAFPDGFGLVWHIFFPYDTMQDR